MVRRERHANNVADSLNGAIDGTTTSVVLSDGSSFPSEGDFRILIDSEIMLVTARVTNTLTVIRGQDGTSGASHSDSASVTLIETTGGFDRLMLDSYPNPEVPMGRILAQGVTKVAADFTWLNQGTAAAVDSACGGILLTTPSEAAHQVRGKYLAAPSAPWSAKAKIMIGPGAEIGTNAATTGSSSFGLIGREASTGKFYLLNLLLGWRLSLWRMTNVTTFSAEVDTAIVYRAQHRLWLELEDNNVDVIGRASFDGRIWTEFWREGRTAFLAGGIDQIGFGGSNANGLADTHFILQSWILE